MILSGVAPPHIVEALFATISYRLEPDGRATRFPVVMDSLYPGRLTAQDAPAALLELGHIEAGLKALPPERAVWSFTDLRRMDDSGQPVNHAAKNLYEYFIAEDGEPLLVHIRSALEQGTNVTFDSPERRTSVRSAVAVLTIGLAWAACGYLFFPNHLLLPHGGDSGPLLWPFGLFIAVCGAFTLLFALRPTADKWVRRHPELTMIIFSAMTLAFLWLTWRTGGDS